MKYKIWQIAECRGADMHPLDEPLDRSDDMYVDPDGRFICRMYENEFVQDERYFQLEILE